MNSSLNSSNAVRRLALTAVAVVVAVLPFVAQTGSGPADATAKLSTILAQLARAVPQQQGPVAQAGPLSREALPRAVQDAMHGRHLRMNDAGEVQVYVLLQAVDDAALQALSAHGVTVEIRDPARKRVQARVPAGRLQEVASLPMVTFIRLPNYAIRRIGSFTTEGDAISHASDARTQFSIDGTGVKVGVLSDGIKGMFATGCTSCGGASGGPIATGDLPASTGTRNASGVLTASSGGVTGRSFQANSDLEGLPPASPPCGFAGAGAEGTALLEIVHDLAPGAQLAFANADTDLAFNQAVNFLASTNDVVVDDLGFFGDAYDGTSAVSSNTAAALNNPSNRIRTYVTSVGNEADEHYYGAYTDSGVDGTTIGGITQGGRLHLFQANAATVDVLGLGPRPYNLISLPRSAEVVIFLSWDDPMGASTNNYDLYLVQQSTGKVVASSVDVQNGHADPVEFIDYVNGGAADSFWIVIQNVGDRAQAKNLNLFSFGPECALAGPGRLSPTRFERHNFNTATQSVAAQSDAGGSPVSVISVGAICSASSAAAAVFGSALPNPSCLDRNNATAEFFSSRGPTLDGRTKPDVASIDGVSITAAGSFSAPFFGTSAAAPHVAGIAALTLQSAPCLVSGSSGARDAVTARTTLRDLILNGAVALASPAPDNTFGAGRADALRSVQRALPVYARSATSITVNGNTPLGASITPALLGFSDPNQCPLTGLSWTGGCGTSPGATMNCPFGTTTVTVGASNNGAGYSPGVALQIAVTSFAVTAAPTSAAVDAGQSASYQVTLSPQGGAFTGSVALACGNLPPGATCSFDPPTVTPAGGTAQSTVTIRTTARTAAAARRGGMWSGWAPRAPGRGAWLVGQASRLSGLAPADRRPWAGAALLLLLGGAWSLRPARARVARRRPAVLASGVSFAVLALALHVACGPGGGTPNPAPGTPPAGTAPSVSLSPTSLAFGSQTVGTTSVPQSVTLTNSGTAALTITAISAAGDFAQTNTCGGSVAQGGSCTIGVTFTPTAAGARTGSLTIADNAANSPQSVSLTGTGVSAGAGTPAGTYTVTVAGTSGTLVQSATVSLTVR
jgi:hypothetical protein